MTPEEKFQQVITEKRAVRDRLASQLTIVESELYALEVAYKKTFGDPEAATATPKGAIAGRLYDAIVAAGAEGRTSKELRLATGFKDGTIKQNIVKWLKQGKVVRVSFGRYRATETKGADNGRRDSDPPNTAAD
jgi:hypothetical protein